MPAAPWSRVWLLAVLQASKPVAASEKVSPAPLGVGVAPGSAGDDAVPTGEDGAADTDRAGDDPDDDPDDGS